MKPILFNTEMVRAILDGRKTVTRRIVKPQPGEELAYIWGGSNHGKWGFSPDNKSRYEEHRAANDWKYWAPPCHADDILYVRETFRIDYLSNIIGTGRVHYKADGSFADIRFAPNRYDMMRRAQLKPGWRPNENMPREAARIFLRVTDVRVERLQTSFFEPICPVFAVQAEGIDIGDTCRECIENYGEPCCVDTVDEDGSDLYGGECGELDQSRGEFSDLWDSTIKPADRERYGWAANPWVWVIEFERCEKPEVA